jgi:hypothetical protein
LRNTQEVGITGRSACIKHFLGPYGLKDSSRDGSNQRDKEEDGRDGHLASSREVKRKVAVIVDAANSLVRARAGRDEGRARASGLPSIEGSSEGGGALSLRGDVVQGIVLSDVDASSIGEATHICLIVAQ